MSNYWRRKRGHSYFSAEFYYLLCLAAIVIGTVIAIFWSK